MGLGARHFRGYQVCHQGMHRHLILFDSLFLGLFSKQACPVVPTFCVSSYCILLFYTLLIRVGFLKIHCASVVLQAVVDMVTLCQLLRISRTTISINFLRIYQLAIGASIEGGVLAGNITDILLQ